MDRDVQMWLIVLAAATALSVTIQLAVLLGLLIFARRVRAKLKSFLASSSSKGPSLSEVAASAQQALDTINRLAQNLTDLIERIRPVVDQAATVSRTQVARADQVLGGVLTNLEKAGLQVEQGVREVRAVSAGFRS